MDHLYDHLTANDAALSRTVRTGKVAVSTHREKRAPLITGDELVSRVSENRRKIAELLGALGARAPEEWFDFYVALILVGHQALDGLEAQGLLRRWEYDPKKYNVIT